MGVHKAQGGKGRQPKIADALPKPALPLRVRLRDRGIDMGEYPALIRVHMDLKEPLHIPFASYDEMQAWISGFMCGRREGDRVKAVDALHIAWHETHRELVNISIGGQGLVDSETLEG